MGDPINYIDATLSTACSQQIYQVQFTKHSLRKNEDVCYQCLEIMKMDTNFVQHRDGHHVSPE